MTPQEAATRLVNALCRVDGVLPENIASICVTPHTIELVTYKTDANGNKFITDDGVVATAAQNFSYRYPS